jgi:hypothetical protein
MDLCDLPKGYFSTAIDEATRYATVDILSQKRDTVLEIKQYMHECQKPDLFDLDTKLMTSVGPVYKQQETSSRYCKHRSTTGWVATMYGGAASWSSKKHQPLQLPQWTRNTRRVGRRRGRACRSSRRSGRWAYSPRTFPLRDLF